MIFVEYENLCNICNGNLFDFEIEKRFCRSKKLPLCISFVDKLLKEFETLFKKTIGEMRSIQKFWARRVFFGESFAAVAPTGIGKTSFGILMAIFLANMKKRSYMIFPTTILVNQAVERIKEFCSKLGMNVCLNEKNDGLVVAFYHGNLKKAEKEKFFEILKDKSYDILITTTAFLPKNFKDIGTTFDFIFVDDVDAVLKASKNVDRILILLGFHKTKEGWKGKARGVLMVSTATAKKGEKANLFRELLNFDVGSTTYAVRNVEDIAINSAEIADLKRILKLMGKGGIIYARRSEDAERIYEELKDDFKIGIVSATSKKDYELFERGEIDYLVGTAYFYGTLVRGLDLPERIRFVVFHHAPTFRIRIEDIDDISVKMLRVLALIFRDDERVKKFIPYLSSLSDKQQRELKEILKELISKGGYEEKDVVVRANEVIFPDLRTYIQGSGRASRLFAGGITKGASFLLEDDRDVLNAFVERAKYYDIEFKSLDQIDIDALIKEIDETRDRFRKRGEAEDIIRPTLFIVESPTKAKQIAKFFGQPTIKIFRYDDRVALAYEVPTTDRVLLITASLGHMTDLITNKAFHGVEVDHVFRPIYASIKKCRDCLYQFTEEKVICPKCGSGNIDDSKSRIELLRKLAKQAGNVIIGTDPDAEGEKIAWDIKNLLTNCGEIKRAEFHEVTRKAIVNALNNLRDIDENLVKAQIVRRIEDRWIGFVLSQKLWDVFNNRNLSAGRAQTPVLGWIIKRAEENKEKKKVAVIDEIGISIENWDKEEIELNISLIEEREESKTPLPPYTTDTMLNDANSILKLSANETMRIAQELFESGLCTYHRTDSTTVSDVGLRIAKEYLGDDFVGRRWEKEGAHECIRPTRAVDRYSLERLIQEGVISVENLTWKHLALYDLIFRRFMASQCRNFDVKIRKYRIEYDGRVLEEERVVDAKGKAYELYKSVWIKKPLPEGKFRFKAKIIKVPRAPLYTQSDIVALMKQKGIGRPSTYATIIEKLFLRNYVIEKNRKLIPTKIGRRVFNYLSKNYGKFVSEERTRALEEKMDRVEKGLADYSEILRELYDEIREI